MRIAVSCRGSRGDCYPIIAIAHALQRRGHEVEICVPRNFAPLVRELSLPYTCPDEDSEEVMRSFGSGWRAVRAAVRWMARDIKTQIDLLRRPTERADVLVTSVNEMAPPTVAEWRRIPHYRVAYAPVIPGDQPAILQPYQRLPAAVNRAMWWGLNAFCKVCFGPELDRQRAELGLGPIGEYGAYAAGRSHTLLALSSALGPRGKHWRFSHTYVGYCFYRDQGELAPELERFLDDGVPPVYIGFGSCSVADPQQTTRIVLEAVRRAGVRAIVGRGWTGLGDARLPRDVFVAGEAPHGSLFRRVVGVAHHGGSGTVHNAARAGVPQFVMPQFADQYYWGGRMEVLGLGPRAVPASKLTVAALASALGALARDRALGDRARAFARRVEGEDGIAAAVAVIEAENAWRRHLPPRFPAVEPAAA
jgi:UDP:flavonoid glycosyltransferase YjiC (YdhE family)